MVTQEPLHLSASINGVRYERFISYRVSRSIEDGASVFELTIPFFFDQQLDFRPSYEVVLYIGKEKIFTGIIEKMTGTETRSERSVTISGRDSSRNLIDQTLGSKLEFKGPTKFDTVIKKVNALINSTQKVINKTGENFTFATDEQISGATTDKVFDFIEKLARSKECFLSSDTEGNLLITRAEKKPGLNNVKLLSYAIDPQGYNNVLESGFTNDISERYGVYRVHAQGNPVGASKNLTAKQISSRSAKAFDPEIDQSRVLDLQAEAETASINDLKRRAQWEATVRKARSLEYNCKIKDHHINKTLLTTNMVVEVINQSFGIEQPLLVKDITYVLDRKEGASTDLTLISPDAYKAEPLSLKESRKSGGRGDGPRRRKRSRRSNRKAGDLRSDEYIDPEGNVRRRRRRRSDDDNNNNQGLRTDKLSAKKAKRKGRSKSSAAAQLELFKQVGL